jgi:hypothetical protein
MEADRVRELEQEDLVADGLGLADRHARDYDAETGRWTAKDPLEFDGGSLGWRVLGAALRQRWRSSNRYTTEGLTRRLCSVHLSGSDVS